MVDEYQDTNQVQNAIFTAVSDGGRKLFMVGDVKQSIYRFRLADPTIFLDKYRRFKPWDQAAEGEERTVVLTRNFRSRPEVLEGTNDLFQNIMSTEFGELDYTQDQALAPEPPSRRRETGGWSWTWRTCPSWGTRRKGSGRTKICWRPVGRPAVSGSCWTGS